MKVTINYEMANTKQTFLEKFEEFLKYHDANKEENIDLRKVG